MLLVAPPWGEEKANDIQKHAVKNMYSIHFLMKANSYKITTAPAEHLTHDAYVHSTVTFIVKKKW
jgi:hypothetical protein